MAPGKAAEKLPVLARINVRHPRLTHSRRDRLPLVLPTEPGVRGGRTEALLTCFPWLANGRKEDALNLHHLPLLAWLRGQQVRHSPRGFPQARGPARGCQAAAVQPGHRQVSIHSPGLLFLLVLRAKRPDASRWLGIRLLFLRLQDPTTTALSCIHFGSLKAIGALAGLPGPNAAGLGLQRRLQ